MSEWPTRTTTSGSLVISPKGRIGGPAATSLKDCLLELVGNGKTYLVVELSEVEALDSAGLGALIAGLKAARQTGGDLVIAAPNERVSTVLEITKLNRVLRSYDTADKAAFDDVS